MAIRFDATTDRVYRTANVPSKTAFTLCGWFKRSTATNEFRSLFGLSHATSVHAIEFVNNASNLLFLTTYVEDGSSSTTFTTPAVGTWFFAAIVGNGTNITAYVSESGSNTWESKTAGIPSQLSTAIVWVGDNGWSEGFNGCAENVMCYDEALTQAQLELQKYKRIPVRTTSLNFWWPMVSVTGTTYLLDYFQQRNGTAAGSLTLEHGAPVGWGSSSIVISKSSAAGQSVSVGQASENDSAQAVSRSKAFGLGQVIESDSAQAVARIKARGLAQALEADTSQSIGVSGSKVIAVGQASESDAAQAITRKPLTTKTVRWGAAGDGAGYAVGWDTVSHAGGTANDYANKANAGTNLAYTITGLSVGTTYYVGVSTYVSYGDTGTWSLVDEFSFVAAPSMQLGQACEEDSARVITRGLPVGTFYGLFARSGLLFGFTGNFLEIGQALESDGAQAISIIQAYHLVQAAESDAAQPVTHAKRIALAQSLESESAQAIVHRKSRAVAQSLETDIAQPVSVSGSKIIGLGQASESDIAQTTAWSSKRRLIAAASETDAAQIILVRKDRAVAQASESDAAQAITWRKSRVILQASEDDSAQTLTGNQLISVAQAAEIEAAQPIGSAAVAAQLGLALEINISGAVAWAPKRRQVTTAFEQDLSFAISAEGGGQSIPIPTVIGIPRELAERRYQIKQKWWFDRNLVSRRTP